MILIPLPLDAICAPGFWRTSPPVPVLERPVHVPRAAGDLDWSTAPWRLALDALTNTGTKTLDYDQWRDVVFAVHHETGGSDEGLDLVVEWSARSAKHVPGWLEARVWPYVKVGGGVTGRTIMSLAARLEGWSMPLTVDGFEAIPDPDDPSQSCGSAGQVGGQGAPFAIVESDDDDLTGLGARAANLILARLTAAMDLTDPTPLEKRKGVPKARHLCTDQANANRLVRSYGDKLLVAAGTWYVWDGRRWKREEGDLYRFTCGLSSMVKDEAAEWRRRAAAEGAPGKNDAVADALEKWSSKCEMAGTINACVGLVRKMLAVDVESLDRNPWLLTVRNGTVDLRTGVLRPHDPNDRITMLADVTLRPGARSLAWERLLADVAVGDRALIEFLRRWFGYCLTGSTREQKFLVHWGAGGNGKSTLIETVMGVMGDYAGIAAPGLMSGKSGGHSADTVALVGKRMVTAHETDENVVLREGFIKSATGSDKMPARRLYGEQFEFVPTHKLQLLTNHKPVIKGTDRGIWRRVRLAPYVASFGSVEEVGAGAASAVADVLLGSFLGREEEREGVLWDLVGAAGVWFREGLTEPEVVRAAGDEYRAEQDRLGAFVRECCELGVGCQVPLAGALGDGLFVAYQEWCRESGVLPTSKARFVRDLARVVPAYRTSEERPGGGNTRRRRTIVHGIRLLDSE